MSGLGPTGGAGTPDVGAAVPAHLAPQAMDTAQRRLVAKAIGEFSHERLLSPVPDAGTPGRWSLTSPDGRVRYRFAATVHPLEHWSVSPASLGREIDGVPAPLDAQDLVTEFAGSLGIPDRLLDTYLEEVAATLAAGAWKATHSRLPVEDLVAADFQTVEAAMTEGHPCFVANSGRIGYGLGDHDAYAPEAGRPVRLHWVAARREHCGLSLGAGLTEEALYDGQLGAAAVAGFATALRHLGLDPAAYRYLPVHPWQWEHKIAVTFAPDVAARRLVPLGPGPTTHRAQQSVRTFLEVEDPSRHYVKTALSVQNMGFMRGLSPAYMRHTPAINDWVSGLVTGDPELRSCGFGVLREVAAAGYTGDAHHRHAALTAQRTGAPPPPSAHRKMLAALWRESPLPRLAPGERVWTMASLLHLDQDGHSLAAALVRASGLPADDWVARYLRAYLRPVAHCLLAHRLAFMPHGENVILVLRGAVVDRVLMKDIGEEVAVLDGRPLPPDVERVRTGVPPDVAALSVFTDVFDGFLRHLAAVLEESGTLAAETFWDLAGKCLADHARDHPHLHDVATGGLDLFASRFAHSCLNRLQLRNTLQMVDLTDQANSLMFAGTLANPVAAARPPAAGTATRA